MALMSEKFFFFPPFFFLAKVDDVLQSERGKGSKEIYLFLDGDVPLPPSRQAFILPSATFFTPNYFPPRKGGNAVHFSPLITFSSSSSLSSSPTSTSAVTSCCLVAFLHPGGRNRIYNTVWPWKRVSSDLNFRI